MSVISHQAYGPLVGVPRLLDLLERHGIRSTFFVPGYTAHRYPDVVRRLVDAGHEIAHHGYLHEQPTALTEAEEIEAIDRGLAALQEVAGVRPTGYRAPMWDLSWRTPTLLAERGFLYDSSLMDADTPYELAVGDTSLVEIPIQWALDDWEQYCFLPDLTGSGLIETPAKAVELWRAEFRAHARGRWVLGADEPPVPQRAAVTGGGTVRAHGRGRRLRRRVGRPPRRHRRPRAQPQHDAPLDRATHPLSIRQKQQHARHQERQMVR